MQPESPRTAAYEYRTHIATLEALVRDMLPHLDDEIGAQELRERARELGLEER